MSPPLSDELVEFADGHSNNSRHLAQDVAAFLMWTAEPKMMARQRVGLISVGMLMLLGVLLYLSNKKLWRDIKRKT
jgi:ubiquinol-cytochrome c reductase cytochrome c1 subunit